jgi:transcriptional regulator with XRE-family HTH domain
MIESKEFEMKLADRIRRGRKLAGMSQLQLAQALNVQRSTVANWEGADNITPGADRLRRLASVLSVSFEWLATGRGEMGLPGYIQEVPAVEDLLVLEDPREIRLVRAWRGASSRVKLNLLEAAELHSSSSQRRAGDRRIG